MKPIVLITMGDFNGVGPEVVLKAVRSNEVQQRCKPVLVGSIDVFDHYARSLHQKIFLREIDNLSIPSKRGENEVLILNFRKFDRPRISSGKLSAEAGGRAAEAIEASAMYCLKKQAHAMVTAPVSKEALQAAGYRYPGQTEMLAEICAANRVAMMFVAKTFRIGLATVHLPLKLVHQSITKKHIFEKLSVIHSSLKRDFLIASPRIAVLGLNPHAGENGAMGMEEQRDIIPAIRRAQTRRMRTEGPFPADGFFGTHSYNKYDAVLAMYHDQGLVPLKMFGFEQGVNFTAGLPIVRTSPDHGTAFDIAGKGTANPRSMIEAIKLAVMIVKNRSRG